MVYSAWWIHGNPAYFYLHTCEIPRFFRVWLSFQWPSSCPNIASISSFEQPLDVLFSPSPLFEPWVKAESKNSNVLFIYFHFAKKHPKFRSIEQGNLWSRFHEIDGLKGQRHIVDIVMGTERQNLNISTESQSAVALPSLVNRSNFEPHSQPIRSRGQTHSVTWSWAFTAFSAISLCMIG